MNYNIGDFVRINYTKLKSCTTNQLFQSYIKIFGYSGHKIQRKLGHFCSVYVISVKGREYGISAIYLLPGSCFINLLDYEI